MRLYKTAVGVINLDNVTEIAIHKQNGMNCRDKWALDVALATGVDMRPVIKTLAEYTSKDAAEKALDDMLSDIAAYTDGEVLWDDPDRVRLTYAPVTDTVEGHADRQDNTDQIERVDIEGDIITIKLGCAVEDLKDFNGGGPWGVHKWLGIGLSAGVTPITGLMYNGQALDANDIEEAGLCSLPEGYFVRWVAADLVLAGDNSKKSIDHFMVKTADKSAAAFTIKIIEG